MSGFTKVSEDTFMSIVELMVHNRTALLTVIAVSDKSIKGYSKKSIVGDTLYSIKSNTLLKYSSELLQTKSKYLEECIFKLIESTKPLE